MLKHFTIALMASVASLVVIAQNLVSNPSFEKYLECPFSTGYLDNDLVDWYSWAGTCDFFNSCSNDLEGFAGVPQNGFGYQWPISGDGYAGLFTYASTTINDREYMASQLLEPLTIGETYYVVFHASMWGGGNKMNFLCASNHVGLRFFKDPTYSYFPPVNAFQPDNFAHLDYSEILTDSISWTRIEATFTADDNYNWLSIGNFFTDENTLTLLMNETGTCWSAYYIENVCVAINPADCEYLLSSTSQNHKPLIEVYPNPASEIVTIRSDKPIWKIEVVDFVGRVVAIEEHSGISTLKFSVLDLNKGVYVLRVFSNSSFTTHKFLKV
jgi:hypothetical protein